MFLVQNKVSLKQCFETLTVVSRDLEPTDFLKMPHLTHSAAETHVFVQAELKI